MSALGQKQTCSAKGHVRFTPQKRTCAAQKVMSALPPKADMCGALADVRFVPIADISKQLGLSDFGPTVATA